MFVRFRKLATKTPVKVSYRSLTTTTTKPTQQIQCVNSANLAEETYLNICKDVIRTGFYNPGDRTGTGTYSKFGITTKYSLRDNRFPLLTTKEVFFRGVFEEWKWMVSGSTNSNDLSKKGVKIWDANGSRQALDKLGFTRRQVGDLGPVYGHQWRRYSARYYDLESPTADTMRRNRRYGFSLKREGVDQIADLVKNLKTNPHSRRHLLLAWNPHQLKQMALPPCHVLAQFYVAPMPQKNNCNYYDGQQPTMELSCSMVQRSTDLCAGAPFNIAFYSLFTVLLSHHCGFTPGVFTHFSGDTHVYSDHVKPFLSIQAQRKPRPFPTLKVREGVKRENLWDYEFSDLVLEGYNPYPKIHYPMSV